MPATIFDWTLDAIAKLREMHADGYSSREIAEALGAGATRNAVIGKISRLGLGGQTQSSITRKARLEAQEAEAAAPPPTASGGQPLGARDAAAALLRAPPTQGRRARPEHDAGRVEGATGRAPGEEESGVSFNPCPNCGGDQSDVKDSRAVSADLKAELGVLHATRRRRVCRECGGRWSTVEIDVRDALQVSSTAPLVQLLRGLSPADRTMVEQVARRLAGLKPAADLRDQPHANGAHH